MADTADSTEEGVALFRMFRDLEARCLSNAKGLPQRDVIETPWEGVLFSVGGIELIAPLDEVKEILNFSMTLTRVPGTKNWVMGVANIRGNLLPVIDLQSFLLDRPTVPGRRSRVLVLEIDGVYTGLLVDQMVGIRHFKPSDRVAVEQQVKLAASIGRYVQYQYEHDGRFWPVFSMKQLSESQEFVSAAA